MAVKARREKTSFTSMRRALKNCATSSVLAIHSDARAAIIIKVHMTYTKVSDAIRLFVTTNTATRACAA